MSLNFRFAIVSDLHVALPHTIWDHPNRFHLVEVSIPAFEIILQHLEQLDLDFLLIPGDLTQHGEPENHAWLAERLARLPFPTYVVPGNHDVPTLQADHTSIGLAEFPSYYRKFGYSDPQQLYYHCEILPGVRLIGLNSNQFDADERQIGRLDTAQLVWLEKVLATITPGDLVMVMVHHNVVEHLPNQANHVLGRRYMLDNAPELLSMLQAAGVQLVFTGHLHVQDIARDHDVYDITTGSLASYPHPYRVLQLHTDRWGRRWLQVESHRVEAVPDWPELQDVSRQWMGDRSYPFMMRLLTHSPLNLSPADAEQLAPSLRYFWAHIADGDTLFDFSHLPHPARYYFESFGAKDSQGHASLIDNHTTLLLHNPHTSHKSTRSNSN